MALKSQIDADLKSALLSRDGEKADVLRGLKTAILYEEVAQKKREAGLSDEEIEKIIARESKKRVESAELFARGGNQASADKELREKVVLEGYLPKQLTDEELLEIAKTEVAAAEGEAHMGKLIGAVKQKVGSQADGARIAAAVKKAIG